MGSAGLLSHIKTMKKLLAVFCSFLLVTSAFADLNLTAYLATTGTGKNVGRGCTEIVFDLSGFSGTIGNITYSNRTLVITLQASNQDGQRLGAVPYVVTSGILNIMEVR